MSGDHVSLGRKFESAAAGWLEAQGYEILMRNYTVKGGEIDIIAKKDKTLCFIEVKARKDGDNIRKYGRPASAVNSAKREHLIFAAEQYIKEESENIQGLFKRFDVLEIYYTVAEGDYLLRFKHFPSAFTKSTTNHTKEK